MVLEETNALCIHQSALKEHDAIVWFYTESLGAVRAVIKGIKRSTSKNRGAAIPLTLNHIGISRRQQTGLFTLRHYERLESFPTVHQQIERIAAGSVWMDVVRYLGQENDADSAYLFAELTRALYQLDVDSISWIQTSIQCHKTLLQWAGYELDLERCIISGEPLDLDHTPIHRYSPNLGGFIGTGNPAPLDTVHVSTSTMRLLLEPTDQRLYTHTIKAHRFLAYLWHYRLERHLNSVDFLINVIETHPIPDLEDANQRVSAVFDHRDAL